MRKVIYVSLKKYIRHVKFYIELVLLFLIKDLRNESIKLI